jgi:protein TonB
LQICFVLLLLASTPTLSQDPRADPVPPGEAATPASSNVYDVPPRILRQTKPKYPKAALQARLEGTVEVEFLIDVKGRVSITRIVRSVPGLDAAAVECVRAWRFRPAEKAGKPVAAPALAPVRFRIYDKPKDRQ